MYRHVVMYWLKTPSPAAIDAVCARLHRHAAGLRGVLSLEIGPQAQPANHACDICMGILFIDQAAHDSASTREIYRRIEADMETYVARTTIADFAVESPARRMPRLYAFIGPSNRDGDTLGRLLDAGMEGVRLSLRHDALEGCLAVLETLDVQAARRSLRPEILLDDVPTAALAEVSRRCGASALVHSLPEEGAAIRDMRGALGKDVRLLASVDSGAQLDRLPFLLRHADGIVFARKRICRTLPPHTLPAAQRRVSAATVGAGVPLLLAQGLLSSMRLSLLPSTADLMDVYRAVLDGASALILTQAVAQGKYPVEAMQTLRKTAQAALVQ